MQAETMTIQKVFSDRRQYRVPFYQRAYVWNKADQWERLWDDLVEKADSPVDGEKPPPHFLGAAVLEPQNRAGLLGVETVNIIDGQQRLTTLQFFLAALAICLKAESQTTLLSIVETCLWNNNPETMRDASVEAFKVWPTFRDRDAYRTVLRAPDTATLVAQFPDNFTQQGQLKKIGARHPPALEAVWYFHDEITGWVGQGAPSERTTRLTALTEAVFSDFQIVSISLGEKDDAQIIFETLNGKGAILHATDLIRNFIFMRADQDKADGHALFERYWKPFETWFWTEPQRRGRLTKPRMEWFVHTSLQAVTGDEVEIGRLYVHYQRFADSTKPGLKAAQQLELLDRYGSGYSELVTGAGESAIAKYGKRVSVWDASTTHALALRIANSGLPTSDQAEMFGDLTSYIVRRAICGHAPKNFNKTFLQILKKLASGVFSPGALRAALSELTGSASRWPNDNEFRRAFLTEAVFPGRLDPPRMRSVLSEIEVDLRHSQTEDPTPTGMSNLDVDHIMPTSWFDHWPLPDGSKATAAEVSGLALEFLINSQVDPRKAMIHRREGLKRTFGNLTLLHYGANRSLQNREFDLKRDTLISVSNLHLNRLIMMKPNGTSFVAREKWDEEAIAERGERLFERAVRIWRGPLP